MEGGCPGPTQHTAGIPAFIARAWTAVGCKQAAIHTYTTTQVPCKRSSKSRDKAAAHVVPETGATVHLKREPAAMAGQGPVGLEVLEQELEGNTAVFPGGGMIAGGAVVIEMQLKPALDQKARPIIRDLADDVVTVSEEEIKRATRLVWERMKLLIEPTAGALQQFQTVPRDMENVCIVLCRGNVDLSSLTWLTDLPGKAE